jgi:hypothetical protein
MEESTENATYSPFELFEEDFNLELEPKELEITDVPDSEDVDFDFINLDSADLTRAKKSNFWDYLINTLGVHIRYGEKLTIDKLISYYPSYEEPLFYMKNNLHFSVERCYGWILKYAKIDGLESKGPHKKVKKLHSICMDKGEQIVDEVYLILIKMLRKNPEIHTIIKIWEFLAFMASYRLPSLKFLYPVYNYLLTVIEHNPSTDSKTWAKYVLKRMYR